MATEPDADQRRLREVERLQRLLDHAPAFMAVVGRDLRFYLANRAYRESIGQEDVVGRLVADVFPPDRNPESLRRVREVMETGEAISGSGRHFRLPDSDGGQSRERVLDYRIQPIVEDGEIIAALITGNDVTDRFQAEARLRESEARFRLIADSAPVPMWVSNPDRSRSFVNKAYADFLKLSIAAAATLDWREILHPDDHDRIVAESIAGEASRKPFVLEGRYRGGDGQWHWLRSTSQPRLGPEGEFEGFIGVAHDVTEAKEAEAALEQRVAERTAELQSALDRLTREVAERERAEDALRQAQKMEAVGQLTGGIAHDFNNLLTPVIGGLEMITGHLTEPRQRRLAEGALESARRGAKLATQLLAFSRVQRLAMAPVEVNRVIDNLGQILRHSIGPEITISTRLAADAGHALCDSNQLENAILNLAINARDAMAQGGSLTIMTSAADEPESADLAAGRYVRIAVQDDGHGMPPEVIERALEPFFSTKPIGKGTGLGLAQVYAIANQSGGGIRIESAVGAGTRIDLLLPQVPAATKAAAVAEERPAPAASRGASIVLIDDDPEVRAFLIDALAELGHAVTAFDSGGSCLEALATLEADLFLVDYAMPGMTGTEFVQRLRERRPGQRVAFVTGYAESDRLLASECSAVPLLQKPFSLAALARLIERETGSD